MLSYQHIYHAGGWADLHKHAVLCCLWSALQLNHSALVYADSHAGRGVYDLGAAEAQKTREYETGVVRLSGHRFPKSIVSYKRALERWMPLYAGSPACIAALARTEDAMVLCELHPGEFKHLEQAFAQQRGVTLFKEDGHAALLRHLPEEKAGLILIDPSYEVKSEYEQTAQTAMALRAAFPSMAVLIWYPVIAGRDYYHALENGLGDFELSRFAPVVAPEKGMVESRLALLGGPQDFKQAMTGTEKDLLHILAQGNEEA
jgi:23S rRNA (adenine2030-N6)-methyltransferase